jgi:hypothetical protein
MAPDNGAHRGLIAQLSCRSIDASDPYRDIAWDDDWNRIDPADPRWELSPDVDALAGESWYRRQPPERRAEIGLFRVAGLLTVAIDFEAVLQRGLLRFASRLPHGAPEFRYAYHEISEEARHSLMFREFVLRTGLDPAIDRSTDPAEASLVDAVDTVPGMFFFSALAGECLFDHLQRRLLARGDALPPVLQQINAIHIAEEARHVSFAHAHLRATVPGYRPRERRRLQYQLPQLVRRTVDQVLLPGDDLRVRYDIPAAVFRRCRDGSFTATTRRTGAARVVRLASELGLVPDRLRPLWESAGLV